MSYEAFGELVLDISLHGLGGGAPDGLAAGG